MRIESAGYFGQSVSFFLFFLTLVFPSMVGSVDGIPNAIRNY